jgi:hypothetical protein
VGHHVQIVNADIFSSIVELGFLYMLGDAFGLFGSEEVAASTMDFDEPDAFLEEDYDTDLDVDDSIDGIDEFDMDNDIDSFGNDF